MRSTSSTLEESTTAEAVAVVVPADEDHAEDHDDHDVVSVEEEEDDEEKERTGLLLHHRHEHADHHDHDNDDSSCQSSSSNTDSGSSCVPRFSHTQNDFSKKRSKTNTISLSTIGFAVCLCLVGVVLSLRRAGVLPAGLFGSHLTGNQPSQLKCPKVSKQHYLKHEQQHEEYNAGWYDSILRHKHKNMTKFLRTMKHLEYDNWGHSYGQMKKGMYYWKSTRFLEVQDNARIYESACGIGLNLYMTLEILHEVMGISNVTVYGNDNMPHSIDVARALLSTADEQNLLPGHGRYGTVCVADSKHIDESFVPSNYFDLVFSGYITPLTDPLELLSGTTTTADEISETYASFCETQAPEAQLAQDAQNEHYRQWVQNMVRIAKPGAPVIIEQVSYPLCESGHFDWGGVAQDFWLDEADNWGASMVEFEEDTIYRKRYHVFMRKKAS